MKLAIRIAQFVLVVCGAFFSYCGIFVAFMNGSSPPFWLWGITTLMSASLAASFVALYRARARSETALAIIGSLAVWLLVSAALAGHATWRIVTSSFWPPNAGGMIPFWLLFVPLVIGVFYPALRLGWRAWTSAYALR